MDSENTVVDFPTDQEQIASIIEDSFPKKKLIKTWEIHNLMLIDWGLESFFYGFGQLLR
jgi:hypothetical protein